MIYVSIDKPVIPLSASFIHESTSWQISETKDFSGELFAESLTDTINLLEYRVMNTIDEDQVVFARAKIHFSNGTESEWSRVITVSEDQKGFKLSNTIIITPEAFIKSSLLDVIENDILVETKEYSLYAGTGKHKSTSWEVTTLLGEHVWSRKEDEDNLTSIIIPKGKLVNNKFYVLKVMFHSETNANSNPFRLPFCTGKNVEGN